MEIAGFVGLVLILSWFQFLPSLLPNWFDLEVPALIPVFLEGLFMLSPILAVMIILTLGSTDEGVGQFVRTRFRWRIASIWYVLAVFLFPLTGAAALILFVVQGEPFPLNTSHLLLLALVFTHGLVANLIEAYGWRGYLQETLQSMYSALTASILVGIVWVLWHLPLFFHPDGGFESIPLSRYIFLLVGVSIIFAWMYNESRGSVVLVTIMHCSFNGSIGLVTMALIDTGGDVRAFVTLSVISVWVVVLVLLKRTDHQTLTRPFTRGTPR